MNDVCVCFCVTERTLKGARNCKVRVMHGIMGSVVRVMSIFSVLESACGGSVFISELSVTVLVSRGFGCDEGMLFRTDVMGVAGVDTTNTKTYNE